MGLRSDSKGKIRTDRVCEWLNGVERTLGGNWGGRLRSGRPAAAQRSHGRGCSGLFWGMKGRCQAG